MTPSLLTDVTAEARDFISLLKPRVMTLVVFTGIAGMVVAPGHIPPVLALLAVLCIALASGAAGAINMWFDRDIDGVMSRTCERAIPTGRISPEAGLVFGIVSIFAAVSLMGLALNWVAGGLLFAAAAFYVVIYTMWLKRRTPQNIVIGGAAGAFPPVIGWAAVTAHVSWQPWLLFLLIFLWTPPHFWALALYKNSDYAKAGVPMMPVIHGPDHTKRLMLLYTVLLVPVALSPYFAGFAGRLYLGVAALLSLIFIITALRVLKAETMKPAKQMFAFSILYLFVLFAALIADPVWPR
jgi:protoheme IX farnesyltransferase